MNRDDHICELGRSNVRLRAEPSHERRDAQTRHGRKDERRRALRHYYYHIISCYDYIIIVRYYYGYTIIMIVITILSRIWTPPSTLTCSMAEMVRGPPSSGPTKDQWSGSCGVPQKSPLVPYPSFSFAAENN